MPDLDLRFDANAASVALDKRVKNDLEHDSLDEALKEATNEVDHRKTLVWFIPNCALG